MMMTLFFKSATLLRMPAVNGVLCCSAAFARCMVACMFCFLTHESLHAQADNAILTSRFERHQAGTFQEKLYMHTDRSFYLAGETVWFKIYCMGAQKAGLLSLSKVAYVELLDAANLPVWQAKIALDSGTGGGHIALPTGLHNGTYLLRAYTNWMKNFDPNFYFHRRLTIVNTINEAPGMPVAQKEDNRIEFYPEGGKLVQGLLSKVAYKINDLPGISSDAVGALIGPNNDTLLRFKPEQGGLGSFVITPLQGMEYKVDFLLSTGDRVTQKLPAAIREGYVLQVREGRDSMALHVAIQTNTSGRQAQLLVHNKHQVFGEQNIALNNGAGSIVIPKKGLGGGVVYFSLFDEQLRLVSERAYYNKSTDRSVIKVEPDKQQYGLRSKVSVKITGIDAQQLPVDANLSMSVVLLDSLTGDENTDLLTYQHLYSDAPLNSIPSGLLLQSPSAATDATLDNLMIAQAGSRLNWQDIVENKKPVIKHLPELEGHIVSGTIVHRQTGAPAAGIYGYLSFPGKDFKLYASRSQPNGDIHFNTKDVYGQRLGVALLRDQDSLYRIDLKSPFSDSFLPGKAYAINTQWRFPQSLLQRSINMQVWNSFYGNGQNFVQPTFSDTLPFYGKPTSVYRLDDYTRFPTMEEVMVEYVPEIAVRKRSGGYQFIMSSRVEGELPVTKTPVILLDGFPMFDGGNKITAFDPRKVERLDVLTTGYFMGTAKYDAIASFRTYDGSLGGFALDTAHTILDFDGLQKDREFFAPVYNNEKTLNDRMADFRSLLYWNGNINLGAAGTTAVEFFTSDLPGRFAVIVQGVDRKGQMVSGKYIFEVKADD